MAVLGADIEICENMPSQDQPTMTQLEDSSNGRHSRKRQLRVTNVLPSAPTEQHNSCVVNAPYDLCLPDNIPDLDIDVG